MVANRARDIFIELVAHVPPEQWDVRLAELAGADAALRDRVAALLEAHRSAASFLDQPAGPLGGTAAVAPRSDSPPEAGPREQPGQVLGGRYKLIEPIGEGGMGSVWMAQQTEPVRRRVALKLIKRGMDSKSVLARFEQERQALALMDHPNIAKVLDAGAADDGRPYFVMELVKGAPITRYCDEHRLTPRQRLDLFVPVCQAIQHAHQKGIIHRDLKPSNVLVALYDDKPIPKVIDFGVAKAAGQPLTEQTLCTGFGAVVGTLEYMSPEQASFNQLDVDTRSDVYALGVLLYELLTGGPPFSRRELEQVGVLDMLRVIREQEPAKPSTKLSTAEGLPTLAANRGTEPAKLTKMVRGELDWIVMKALEKDRNRRYESANSFALDIQRYLADEPVAACPPSTWYQLRKLARRHRPTLAAASAVLLALVVGTVLATWQAVRATRAEVQARVAQGEAEANLRKAHQAVNDSFTLTSQDTLFRQPALEPLRKQLLENAVRYFQDFVVKYADNPRFRAELVAAHLRVGLVMYELNQDWLPHLEKGIDVMDALLASRPSLAELQPLHDGVLWMNAGGRWHVSRGADARRAFARARDQWEGLVRAHPDVHGFRSDLAVFHLGLAVLSGPAESVPLYQRACDLLRDAIRHSPRPHYRTALLIGLTNLSTDLLSLDRRTEADAARQRAEEEAEKLAADFPDTPAYRELLAAYVYEYAVELLVELGRADEAEAHMRKLGGVLDELAQQYPTVARYRIARNRNREALADHLWWYRKRDQASQLYRELVATLEKADRDDQDSQDQLAWLLAICPDPRLRSPARAVAIAERLHRQNPEGAGPAWALGMAHYAAGNYPSAIRELRRALAGDLPHRWAVELGLAMACWRGGEQREARALFDQAVTRAEAKRLSMAWYRILRAEAESVLGISPQRE